MSQTRHADPSPTAQEGRRRPREPPSSSAPLTPRPGWISRCLSQFLLHAPAAPAPFPTCPLPMQHQHMPRPCSKHLPGSFSAGTLKSRACVPHLCSPSCCSGPHATLAAPASNPTMASTRGSPKSLLLTSDSRTPHMHPPENCSGHCSFGGMRRRQQSHQMKTLVPGVSAGRRRTLPSAPLAGRGGTSIFAQFCMLMQPSRWATVCCICRRAQFPPRSLDTMHPLHASSNRLAGRDTPLQASTHNGGPAGTTTSSAEGSAATTALYQICRS